MRLISNFSIEAIEEFLEGCDFIKYQNNLKTKSAVERQLGIIGEAVNQILKEGTDIELKNSIGIIKLVKKHRNLKISLTYVNKFTIFVVL